MQLGPRAARGVLRRPRPQGHVRGRRPPALQQRAAGQGSVGQRQLHLGVQGRARLDHGRVGPSPGELPPRAGRALSREEPPQVPHVQHEGEGERLHRPGPGGHLGRRRRRLRLRPGDVLRAHRHHAGAAPGAARERIRDIEADEGGGLRQGAGLRGARGFGPGAHLREDGRDASDDGAAPLLDPRGRGPPMCEGAAGGCGEVMRGPHRGGELR
mmetsp:Transcript_122077/g.340367  ORF Transcript_122077/g.340367 Transcript_122077/m.340367 type:complete len:213 (+) Transcript_122077:303-941(+)